MTGKRRTQIIFPREVLLVEIERRCADERCNAKNRLGLTKEEARAYRGYTCARCERWHEDILTERDIPDWWEELMVTGLATLRPRPLTDDSVTAAGASEVVARLSTAWRERELPAADERAERDEAGEA
jgi:hypothetical protein